jgi:hypothetical protein
MARRHIAVCGCLALAAAFSPSPAAAKPRNCGNLARPGTTFRVIAIRGVSCKTARHVATVFQTADAPKPWKCTIGTGQKYRGKEIGTMCGYGGKGGLLSRPHAFVTVILDNVG